MQITIASNDGKTVTLESTRRPPPEIAQAVLALAARGSSQADFFGTLLLALDKCVTYERAKDADAPTSIEDALGIEFTADEPDVEN
jgi:hypothetical protein